MGLFLLTIAVVAAWWMKPLQLSAKTWKRLHILAFFAFALAAYHGITIGALAGVWSTDPRHVHALRCRVPVRCGAEDPFGRTGAIRPRGV